MLRYSARALIVVSSFFVLSCADTAVVQTGSIEVQWDMDKIDVFEAAQTFSVVTSDLVDPPDLDEGVGRLDRDSQGVGPGRDVPELKGPAGGVGHGACRGLTGRDC